MIPSPFAVRFRARPLLVGMDPEYARRYYEAVSGLCVDIVPYSPADARWILDNRNPRNRPLRGAWKMLREKMIAKTFQINGETVIFDSDGNVMSAQHRLKAIAEGENTVSILTVYGVNPAYFSTLDQGGRRSAADVLFLIGESDGPTLARALAWAHLYAGPGIGRALVKTIPNEQVVALLDNYPDLALSVAYAREKKRTKLMPASLLAFAHHALTECDPDAAPSFLEKVVDGIGVEADSWEHLLRTRLMEDPVFKRPRLPDQVHILALIFKAFNYSRRNRPVPVIERNGKKVRPTVAWRPNGEKAEHFPALDVPGLAVSAEPVSDQVA